MTFVCMLYEIWNVAMWISRHVQKTHMSLPLRPCSSSVFWHTWTSLFFLARCRSTLGRQACWRCRRDCSGSSPSGCTHSLPKSCPSWESCRSRRVKMVRSETTKFTLLLSLYIFACHLNRWIGGMCLVFASGSVLCQRHRGYSKGRNWRKHLVLNGSNCCSYCWIYPCFPFFALITFPLALTKRFISNVVHLYSNVPWK